MTLMQLWCDSVATATTLWRPCNLLCQQLAVTATKPVRHPVTSWCRYISQWQSHHSHNCEQCVTRVRAHVLCSVVAGLLRCDERLGVARLVGVWARCRPGQLQRSVVSKLQSLAAVSGAHFVDWLHDDVVVAQAGRQRHEARPRRPTDRSENQAIGARITGHTPHTDDSMHRHTAWPRHIDSGLALLARHRTHRQQLTSFYTDTITF